MLHRYFKFKVSSISAEYFNAMCREIWNQEIFCEIYATE